MAASITMFKKIVDFQTCRGVAKVGLRNQRKIAETEYIFVGVLKWCPMEMWVVQIAILAVLGRFWHFMAIYSPHNSIRHSFRILTRIYSVSVIFFWFFFRPTLVILRQVWKSTIFLNMVIEAAILKMAQIAFGANLFLGELFFLFVKHTRDVKKMGLGKSQGGPPMGYLATRLKGGEIFFLRK